MVYYTEFGKNCTKKQLKKLTKFVLEGESCKKREKEGKEN